MSLLTLFLVAISLSMDAFSLSLLYGTFNLPFRMIRNTSITVGIFHFFMPLLGFFFGDMITFFLDFNANLLVGIIFLILALQMFTSVFKQEEVSLLTGLFSYLLFGFTVSIDSFSIGIGIGSLKEEIFLPCMIFSVVSFFFTFLGLYLGKRLAQKFGTISTILGSILLFILGLHYIL